MYVARMEFKRTEDSKLEKGYFIGHNENPDLYRGCYLDENFQPLPRDEKGYQVWDSKFDTDNALEIRID